jgi:TonB family protein
LDFDETDSKNWRIDEDYHLTMGIGEAGERDAALVRERFLLSVIIHLVVVIVVVTNPDLFDRLFPPQPEDEPVVPENVTLVYTPPPAERPQLVAPPPPAPPPPQAQPAPEPPPQPRLQAPAVPRLPQPAVPPPELPRDPGLGGMGDELEARNLPPIGIPELREPAREPPSRGPQPSEPAASPAPPEPKIEAVPRTEDPSQARLQFPVITRPGSGGTEAILRGLARDRATQGGGGVLSGAPTFDPDNPNMSIPGPQILSDTMGVNFQPYLLRIYLLVRRNWYSVIPEIARLGKQGRVALEFSIERNGRVPDLMLRVSSGTDSLDSAALASIRLSNPFPALPPEFPGEDIKLRFIYLYNLPIGSQ